MNQPQKKTLSFLRSEDNEKVDLLQIMIIRHGEPDLETPKWVSRDGATRFFRAYDAAGIKPFEHAPVKIKDGEVTTVYTSHLNRAKHTARLLFEDQVQFIEDPIFRELERKAPNFPTWKLPLSLWKYFARLLWVLGGNRAGIESFKEAKKRVYRAADKLIAQAEMDQKVILVAHGLLNFLLIRQLKKRGWKVEHNGGRKYLSASLLSKSKPKK